jgi:flagellin-like protein
MESRGAAPVIAVILLVAITVLLVSTVTVSVFGIDDELFDPTPSVALQMEQDGKTVRITHTQGDVVEGARIEIRGGRLIEKPEIFQAGSTIKLHPTSETVTVVWEGDKTSVVLDTFTVTPADEVQPAPIEGGIICEDDHVSVAARQRVNGDIVATGNVEINKGATVNGDIRAGGSVTLNDGVTVTGDVDAGSSVITIGDATIEGTTTGLQGPGFAPCPM